MKNQKDIFRNRHDYFYFLMASQNVVEYENLLDSMLDPEEQKELNDLSANMKTDMDAVELQQNNSFIKLNTFAFRSRMFSVQTILNSVLCLEALINDYAVFKFSQNYFKNHLDRISLESKYILIPQLSVGKTFDKAEMAYMKLKELISIRNKLVHAKSREYDKSDTLSDALSDVLEMVKKTKEYYLTIKLIVKEFLQIDPGFEHLKIYESFFNGEGTIDQMEHYYSTLVFKKNGK